MFSPSLCPLTTPLPYLIKEILSVVPVFLIDVCSIAPVIITCVSVLICNFLIRSQIHVQKTSTKQQQTNNYAMTIISTNKTPKLTTNSQQINDQKAVKNLNSSSSKTKTSSRNTIYSKKHVFCVFLYETNILLTCVLHSFLNNSVPWFKLPVFFVFWSH